MYTRQPHHPNFLRKQGDRIIWMREENGKRDERTVC
jgi:hypothetical protein